MIYDGVRVLDFSQGMAGSMATMLMADNGAEVIKVEPPSGDPFRHEPAWLMWNRSKQSVVLDLSEGEGRETARARPFGGHFEDSGWTSLARDVSRADDGGVRHG